MCVPSIESRSKNPCNYTSNTFCRNVFPITCFFWKYGKNTNCKRTQVQGPWYILTRPVKNNGWIFLYCQHLLSIVHDFRQKHPVGFLTSKNHLKINSNCLSNTEKIINLFYWTCQNIWRILLFLVSNILNRQSMCKNPNMDESRGTYRGRTRCKITHSMVNMKKGLIFQIKDMNPVRQKRKV